MTHFKQILKLAKNLCGDIRGAASVFMICLLPAVLALGGLAIDGSNAWRVHTILQVTADAAAAAASIDLPDTTKARQAALTYAAKNMPVTANGSVLAATDVLTGNWNTNTRVFTPNSAPLNAVQVIVKRSAANSNALPTTFLSLIGQNSWNVAAKAIASKGAHKLWVSLVLDNTGSMCQPGASNPCPTPVAGSKIVALKTATNQLLTTMQGASNNPGDVMVTVIPFAKDVNVGTANVNAAWIDWTDWDAPPANGAPASNVGPGSACPYTTAAKGFVCQSTPTNASSSAGNIPSSGTFKGYICPGIDNGSINAGRKDRYYNGCYNSVGASAPYTHNWIANNHNTWSGCVMDRTQANDVGNATPVNAATRFPAENAVSCTPSVMAGLSSDWVALTNKVNAMQAAGATNQTIGLVWGWQAQTQGGPMNPPALPDQTRRFIILLSDGLNTQNRWSGDGANQSANVDARMAAACANAKAAGITIYTVFVDLNGTVGNSTVLQNCASDHDKYFDLTTSGQIITTLNEIGQQIAYHRIVE
jgi:Flp pilus assembly protein TadG